MAPTTKSRSRASQENAIGTRSRGVNVAALRNSLKNAVKTVGKRKAGSPLRESTTKRAAFGDITNAITNGIVENKNATVAKKVVVQEKQLPPVKIVRKKYQDNKAAILNRALKNQSTVEPPTINFQINADKDNVKRRNGAYNKEQITAKLPDKYARKANGHEPMRISEEFSEESLYVSAREEVSDESKHSGLNECNKNDKDASLSRDIHLLAITDDTPSLPAGVVDFDKENWKDPLQVSNYAMDIFNYLKNRESEFSIEDYLPRQQNLTSWMRAMLVDWMVEVQESFELNHETLYLAVKLVDLYLCKKATKRDELQLLGAASLFIASKFDERIPPLIRDFLYICDGAYTLRQILTMEMDVLKVIDFDLGIPLSYRFLRRYARCARVSMPTLTLARFILEYCLMEYPLISLSDSKMAAAALFLAIKMKKLGTWTATHQYYTGYTLEEILPIARAQNSTLHKKPKEALSTVRNKYSHKIFFEVAKVPLITNDEMT